MGLFNSKKQETPEARATRKYNEARNVAGTIKRNKWTKVEKLRAEGDAAWREAKAGGADKAKLNALKAIRARSRRPWLSADGAFSELEGGKRSLPTLCCVPPGQPFTQMSWRRWATTSTRSDWASITVSRSL